MAKHIPFKLILEKANHYQQDMTRFLRDMVAIPSESCDEKRVVHRIKEEMEKVGFDKVVIDPMGNVLGYIGHGPRLVAMDAHIDTVGIGNIKNWNFDPYEGMETDELIGGRGTSDQEGEWPQWSTPVKLSKTSDWKMSTPCWSPAPFRKKIAMGCAGSTSSSSQVFARSLLSAPNQRIVRSTAVSAGVWKFALMSRASVATVPRRNAAITRFSKWDQSSMNCRNSRTNWAMMSSWAKAP